MKKISILCVLSFLLLLSLSLPAMAGRPDCDVFIYVDNGIIVGGPQDGQVYAGTLLGTSARDCITGTDGDDVIRGRAGDDDIDSMGGNDTVYGGAGNDLIAAEGSTGDNLFKGNAGDDFLIGSINYDLILGGSGDDTIWCIIANGGSNGRFNQDQAKGGPGTDILADGQLEACDVVRSIEVFDSFPP